MLAASATAAKAGNVRRGEVLDEIRASRHSAAARAGCHARRAAPVRRTTSPRAPRAQVDRRALRAEHIATRERLDHERRLLETLLQADPVLHATYQVKLLAYHA